MLYSTPPQTTPSHMCAFQVLYIGKEVKALTSESAVNRDISAILQPTTRY